MVNVDVIQLIAENFETFGVIIDPMTCVEFFMIFLKFSGMLSLDFRSEGNLKKLFEAKFQYFQ